MKNNPPVIPLIDPTANVIKLVEETVKRFDDLRKKESMFIEKLRETDIKRLDDLRIAESKSNETLRVLVETTARNIAESLKSTENSLSNRILSVEKAQYENKGKEGMSEPMMRELVIEVKKLAEYKSDNVGITKGRLDMWGWVIAAVMLLLYIGNIIISLYKYSK